MNWKLVYIVYRLWCSCVWYLVVPLAGNRIRVDCRLLVANIAELFFIKAWQLVDFCFWANEPTVHIVRFSRRRVCGCSCWRWWHVTCERWQEASDRWQVTADIKFRISVLLPAHVKKFGVSRMRFFLYWSVITCTLLSCIQMFLSWMINWY